MDAVIIGAGGMLGRHVMRELELRGHRAIAIPRAAARDAAAIARPRAALIIDCAGASMMLGLGHGWRGYRAVDTPIGLAAVDAARRSGARLIYVGVHHPPAMRSLAYIDAHERVIAAMRDVDGCIVRATGFFSAFAAFLPFAQRGVLFDVGNGRALTNPIDERDLAELVVDCATTTNGPRELSAGGPDVMPRRELLGLVAAAAGRRVRIVAAPVWLARFGSVMLRPLHPRIAQLTAFVSGLGANDVVAPVLGTRRLADYLVRLPHDRSLTAHASDVASGG